MGAQAPERVVNGVKTRILHNKDYVEVAERLRIVHALEQAEEKSFEMVESAPFEMAGRVLWKVVIKFNNRLFIGNAEAKMDAPKNSPDGTNPFECAETSAMGRALAFAGLGTLDSIASYDEIARQQPFQRVVEQSHNGSVVEAGHAVHQLEDPRIARLADIGKAMRDKGLIAQDAKLSDVLKECGRILDVNITALGEMTESRFEAVGTYVKNAKPQLAAVR